MKEKKMNKIAKILDSAAGKVAKVSGDSLCFYIYHQPKMPDNLEKLNEHSYEKNH
jgi:hypothetical protein